MSSEKYTLLIPAHQVPEGHEVTKVTGAKEYTIRKEILIRDFERSNGNKEGPDNSMRIKAENGTVFLVSVNGMDITAFPGHKEVKVVFTEDELYTFISENEEIS